MLNQPEKMIYHGNVGALTLLADTKVAFARRDIESFEPRGWNENRLAALDEEVLALRRLPTDDELEQAIRKAETRRKTARVYFTTAVQVVLSKARQVYHPSSAEYRGYGAAKLHQAPDPAFALLLEQVAAVGLQELATAADDVRVAYQRAGLAAPELVLLEKGAGVYRKLLLAVAAAETRRSVGTQNRVRAANVIYRQVAALAELGKSLFIATDAARYNDYLLLEPAP